MKPHWTYRDELALIDRAVMKGKRVIISEELQQQGDKQFCVNHMHYKDKAPSQKISLLGQHE